MVDHHKAAEYLKETLQLEVKGYDTICSFNYSNRKFEISFKNEEAVITAYIPEVPRTSQTYKRHVVAIDSAWDLAKACNAVTDEINKLTKFNKIIVHKRNDNWMAFVDGRVGVWGTGITHLESIGDLIISHPEQFGIEVKVQ